MKSGIGNRPREVEAWLDKQSPAHQAQAQGLADVVHRADTAIDEAIKWRRLTFTVGDNWHHWLFAVAISKGGVSLVFHKGVLLDDPANLLRGEGRYLRHIPYEVAVAHPDAVTALSREAISHQTDMLEE
jgi:hypothetical protein